MNAAIAQHLNIAESAITEIQEWAHVLWVRFVGGVRFVSKKVMKPMENVDFTGVVRNSGKNVFVKEGKEIRLPQSKLSNKYNRVSITLPVGTIVHVDTYSWNGAGKGQTGWFVLNEKGDLDPSSEPKLAGKGQYPHEIYEEIEFGRNYEGQ